MQPKTDINAFRNHIISLICETVVIVFEETATDLQSFESTTNI